MKEATGVRFIGLVNEKLAEITSKHEVDVIFASQSGDTAGRHWSIPDAPCPNIEYIYVQPKNYYLSIQRRKSTITEDFYEDGNPILETDGRDLMRALLLFSESDVLLIQSLMTGHVYIDKYNLIGRLGKLIPYYFSARKYVHHYWIIANQLRRALRGKEEINRDAYLFLVRSVLSAEYVLENDEPPPVGIGELLTKTIPSELIQQKIYDVWKDDDTKTITSEYLNDDLFGLVDKHGKTYPFLHDVNKDPFFYDRLNRLFRELIEC